MPAIGPGEMSRDPSKDSLCAVLSVIVGIDVRRRANVELQTHWNID